MLNYSRRLLPEARSKYNDDQDQVEEDREEVKPPEYIPPKFSSPEEENISEDEAVGPIQSHANIDLITFDSLNYFPSFHTTQEKEGKTLVILKIMMIYVGV